MPRGEYTDPVSVLAGNVVGDKTGTQYGGANYSMVKNVNRDGAITFKSFTGYVV